MGEQALDRYDRFRSHRQHPMLGKIYNRLGPNELSFCRDFIMRTSHMTDDQFIFTVNRIDLDKPVKMAHSTDIWALLSQCIPIRTRKRRT